MAQPPPKLTIRCWSGMYRDQWLVTAGSAHGLGDRGRSHESRAPRFRPVPPGKGWGMHDERTPRYPGDFSCETVVRDGALEMILGGEIDMGAAFQLESSFDACLSAGGAGSVVFDLADVTFIDSAGIGSLLSMQERAGQLGLEVSVSRVSEPVQRVLDVAGVSGTHRR